ncbi:MAG: nucleotide sugar dehydrogenase [Actinomycetota bacterium]|nr:nucleotide sugar dehydrogenase [Actinomycetota bacterium]
MALRELKRLDGPGWAAPLLDRIERRDAVVGVVGLGYVGLPLILTTRRAGFPVVGVDTSREKIAALREGRSYVSDIAGDDLAVLGRNPRLSTQYRVLHDCDVVLITVPTPLLNHAPDLSFIEKAARGIARHLTPGSLVVLESTTYPGTTEEIVRPILETEGLTAGVDFALAYAPERIDPGQDPGHIATTPRVVGGLTERCTEIALAFYRGFVKDVLAVSSPREAEMAKLIENTYRHVNIALVNEMAMISRELGVNIWEALEAAATKPYGYQPFWPGPGVGGHCIAIDPSYLSWRVGQRLGYRMTFVEHAQQVNARMPEYVVQRVAEALNERGKAVRGARILGIGVAYKANVNDPRESPALTVLGRLAAAGAEVSYHDPYVPEIVIAGRPLASVPLNARTVASHDCAVILTAHDGLDVDAVGRFGLVFDTRGVMPNDAPGVVRL